MIEGAGFEVEGGYGDEPPYHTKAFLRLEGDFVEEFERYLADEDAGSIMLEMPRNEAEKLYKELGEVLYGG